MKLSQRTEAVLELCMEWSAELWAVGVTQNDISGAWNKLSPLWCTWFDWRLLPLERDPLSCCKSRWDEMRAWSLFTSPPLNPVRPDAAAAGFVLFPFTFFILYLLWACDNWKVVNPRRRELSFTLILLC